MTDRPTDHDQALRPRVLIAGVGNILFGDDAFGIEVARRLALDPRLPSNATVIDTGIGGMSLINELFGGYEALIVVDAVERHGNPGTTFLFSFDVENLAEMPYEKRSGFLADMHMATPARAFILAKALGILPSKVFMLGCQPTSYDDLYIGLSDEVERAVGESVERLLAEIANLSAGTDRAPQLQRDSATSVAGKG